MDEELIVDAEGIPILTALVHEHETAAPEAQPAETTAESAAAIADRLLQSKPFKLRRLQLTATFSQQLIDQVD